MIVVEEHSRTAVRDDSLHDFARVDRSAIYCAAEEVLHCNQTIADVKVHQAESLEIEPGEARL